MDKFKTIGLGGLPLVLDDLRWFFGRLGSPNEGMYQAFNNLLRGFGDNLIVQGVVASGTTPNVAITEGWVILDGELIKVDAQTGIDTSTDNKFVKVTTFDSRGNKTFQNATVEDTYEKNRAVVQGTTGNLSFDGDAIGIWQEDAFDASDYTSDTGTWVLTDFFTEVRTFLLGKMMTMSVNITASTIGSGPTDFVKIKVPRGKTVSNVMQNLSEVTFSGSSKVARLIASPSDNTIQIKTIDGTDFPNGDLKIFGQITFEID